MAEEKTLSDKEAVLMAEEIAGMLRAKTDSGEQIFIILNTAASLLMGHNCRLTL